MYKLSNPSNTAEIIKKHAFQIRKKFGQNFLVDNNILDKICETAKVGKEDTVIEIGPGLGNLTQCLAQRAGYVIAIEIDKNLIPILEETLSDFKNIKLINEDVLKTDLSVLAQRYAKGKKIKVVANLPYYITTPIVMSILEQKMPIDSITVMVQKEVAERMQAKPGTKDYGALSLAVEYYAQARIVAIVSAGCFIPKPQVESAVIHLQIREHPPYAVENEKLLFQLIRAAFNRRRKTLQNALAHSQELSISKERASAAIESLHLDLAIRGEKLTLEEFIALSNILSE